VSKSTEKVPCAGRVMHAGAWRTVQCSKSGSLEHEGRHFCKLHHPPTVKAKHDASIEAMHAKWADEKAKADAKAQEAAEQKRRADLFPELLEALKALVSDCMASDFNEHWDSFKTAEAAILKAEGKQ